MKTLLLTLFFFPLLSKAQKVILIDRNFYHPISIADSFSMEQASTGVLAVHHKDLQTISEGMQWLIKHMTKSGIDMEKSFVLKMGNSDCIVTTEKNSHTSKRSIVLNTEAHNIKTSIVLAAGESDKRALQRVTIFVDYLRNNSSLL